MAVLPDVFKQFVPTSNCLCERFRAKAQTYSSCFKAGVIDKKVDPPEVSIAIEVMSRIAVVGPY